MTEQNRTAAAIVLAGIFIGAGLFFGLRDRRSADSPIPLPAPGNGAPAASVPISSEPTVSPPRELAVLPPREPVVPQVPRDKVAQQAAAAIEPHRAMLLEQCWKPAAQGPNKPKPAKFVFNFSFDAQGNQIIRGIAEQRGTGHPDVTSCVTRRLPPIQVPPPGSSVYVEVPFDLP